VHAAAVHDWLQARPSSDFHRRLFGVSDAGAVVHRIVEFSDEHLGVQPADIVFYTVSQGAVAGLVFADREPVACKFLPVGYEPIQVLSACRRVQAAARRAGLPVSTPVAGPVPWRDALVMVDSWLPSPPPSAGSDPAVRRIMADALWQSVAALASQDERDLAASRLSSASLATRLDVEGAPSWLSDLVTTSLNRVAAYRAPPTVVHLDWRTQNVRIEGDDVVAIYDWDSVALETEARVVGDAAAMFSVVYGLPNSSVPTPEAARAFVDDYEAARGRVLTRVERDVVGAAVVRKLAGQALTEHIRDPAGAKLGPLSIRSALLEHGMEYWTAIAG
jgi:hypothetical protein